MREHKLAVPGKDQYTVQVLPKGLVQEYVKTEDRDQSRDISHKQRETVGHRNKHINYLSERSSRTSHYNRLMAHK